MELIGQSFVTAAATIYAGIACEALIGLPWHTDFIVCYSSAFFFSEFFAWPECMCAAHVQYSGMFFVVRSKWSKSLMADALFMLSAHSSRVTFWHIHFIWKSHVQCARVIYATKQMCRNSQVVKHPDICVRRPNRCVTQLIRWTDPTHVCHNNHYGKKYAISIFEDQTLTLELFNRAWAECFCWIGDNVLTVWRIG